MTGAAAGGRPLSSSAMQRANLGEAAGSAAVDPGFRVRVVTGNLRGAGSDAQVPSLPKALSSNEGRASTVS